MFDRDVRKIHFINRIDKNNIGDWICSPLNYFYDYFKKYNLIRHDIDFIDWNEIQREDIVIIGGSGLLYVTETFNLSINKLLQKCDTVIAWSVGFNTHGEQWSNGDNFPEIPLDKFKLISIRDYKHPSNLEYLPCPSVFALPSPDSVSVDIKRKFGLIGHKDLPVSLGNLPIEAINNSSSINEIAEFILSSEAVITNSYHCAFWTMLLRRKAIVINKFSTKFDYYKYRPEFVTVSKNDDVATIKEVLDAAYGRAKIYDAAYDEAINLNNGFFEKVKEIILEKGIKEGNDYQHLYELNNSSLWNTQNELNKIGRICIRLEELQNNINNLHDELYDVINNLHDELYGVNAQLREEISSGRFIKKALAKKILGKGD